MSACVRQQDGSESQKERERERERSRGSGGVQVVLASVSDDVRKAVSL